MKCSIALQTRRRRRLLTVSYALSASVLEPVATDDNSGYMQLPAGFDIPEDTLNAVSAAVETGILAVGVTATVPSPTADPPTAEELAAEVIHPYLPTHPCHPSLRVACFVFVFGPLTSRLRPHLSSHLPRTRVSLRRRRKWVLKFPRRN